MKKFLSVLVLALSVLALVSCSAGEDGVPVGMVRASNEYVDYNLFVPDDWTVETSTGVITAKYSDSILVNVSMMASRAPDGIDSAVAYWQDYRDSFGSVYTDWELVSDEATLLDGHEAHKYVYTGTIGTVSAKYAQTVCVKDGVVYLFTYTADPAKYEEYTADVNKILENFTFKD